MGAFLRFVAWLTVRRARASWRMMAASAFGVVVAVTLVSVAVIHSGTLAEAGLGYALATSPPLERQSIQMVAQDRPLGKRDYERLRQSIEEQVQTRVGWLFQRMHRSGYSETLPFVRTSEASVTRPSPAAYIFFQEGFQEHARLVSGRWPQQTPIVSDDGSLSMEVALGAETARDLRWTEDARLFLVPFATVPEERVAITVVGIVEPTDPGDLYWFQDLTKFRLGGTEEEPIVPLYAGEQGFFDGMGTHYPMLFGTYWWYITLDVESLTAATASRARQSVTALESDINRALPRSLVLTLLDTIIADYKRDLTLARVPLFLFTSLVVGVVLYYLVLIAVMLARDQGAEAAIIRSRGATALQVAALLRLGEGLIIALPAVLVGPFLGWAIASRLPTGDPGVGALSVGLSPSVFVIAAIAGLVCVAVFLASGMGVARLGIVRFLRERGRPPGRPAIFRYAIDLVVLTALGLLWWQIRGRGGFLTERLLGEGLEVDLSLLLGPALALVAASLLLLRTLPLLLRLLSRLVDPLGPPWLAHALKRMARDHFMYGPLAVLLMLATALGVFGASFGATLTRSQADQVRYAIGGEVVVPPPVGFGQPAAELRRTLASVSGVRAVAEVYRGTISTAGSSFSGGGYALLAVDPANLPRVTWFREDLAGKGLRNLLLPLLNPSTATAMPLPEGTERIGVWVRPERSYPVYNLYLRLEDAAGWYESLLLGDLGMESWAYLEAQIPDHPRYQPPFTLVGINISGAPYTGYGSGSIALDDVSAVVEGETQVVEDFESVGPLIPLPNIGVIQDTRTYEAEAAHSGRAGVLFSWTERISGGPRGLFVPPVPMPIPAVGSDRFGVGQELLLRVKSQPIQLSVRDVADYFPTLRPAESPFLIVNLEHLDRYLNILPLGSPVGPTEYWLGLQEGADREQTLEELRDVLPSYGQIREREELAERATGNPLAGGAWSGLALLAAGALGGVAVLGLGLYAGLAVRRARLELGVLQSLGLSRWRVRMMLALEGLVVTAVGLGVGTVMGALVSRWALDYLGVTARGRAVVPPMALAQDGWLAALAFAEIALAAIVATALALVLATRLRLHEVLRVEE